MPPFYRSIPFFLAVKGRQNGNYHDFRGVACGLFARILEFSGT
jgi:hypothetical protein